ncbi:MAG: GNAT family N-acetyltransferase [Muribaculaceae bacterium]|nr:GNAT family N-acetyltransferase [Muribaculaceae bacterium]
MKLDGNNIYLRAVEPDDIDFLYRLENEGGKEETGFATAPLSRQQLHEYIVGYSADIHAERQLRLMICSATDGAAVGTVDITDYEPRDRRGFVGIAIGAAHRRKGYGLEALMILCRYAATTLGMHQLAAMVAVDNEVSRHLFVRAGFKPCGRLRSWLRRGNTYADALLFQKLF